MHVDGSWIGEFGIALHQDADLPLLAHGLLGSRDRTRPADCDWHDHAGKQHEAADRNDDHRIRRQWRQIGFLLRLLRLASPGWSSLL